MPSAFGPGDLGPESFARTWTFLTNHAHVLVVLNHEPNLRLRDVAVRVGITERAVQRIVMDLHHEGYLLVEKEGRRNRYRVVPGRPLRHPVEQHRTVGDLLALVGSGKGGPLETSPSAAGGAHTDDPPPQ